MENVSNTERLFLANEVRLRAEHFGALVFDRRDGTILEVDRQGFGLLLQARTAGICLDDPLFEKVKDTVCFIDRLRNIRILEKGGRRIDPADELESLTPRNSAPWLSAPETVHWAVTYRCGMKCPDCYASRIKVSGRELDTAESKKMIEKLAEWNVFQLAVGGGEPLERKDIAELVKYAASCGLIVHLTTGRQFINADLLNEFAGSLTSLQLGIHADWRQTPDWHSYLHDLETLIARAADNGIKTGANLCLSRSTLKNFGLLVGELGNIGFRRFTLLRYKPPHSIKRWRTELPEREQLLKLKPELEKLSAIPGVDLRLDCALSFLQSDLTSPVAAEHGIIGCSAGNRIAAIAPDGSLYPCSQLVTPELCTGNVYSDSPDKIWHDSKILRQYRDFRNKKSFTGSHCSFCKAKKFCGGCRAFAHDALGGDPGCPAPAKVPLQQCGTKRRKRKDACRSAKHSGYDAVRDLQDSIGYTNWGFPYVTEEQASEWLDLNDCDYPEWIISLNDREYL
jgi:radical SAM protein with 4Fe4S-binding SPASM domain